jgi:hypothetical protein
MNADSHQSVVDACARLLREDHHDHEDLIGFLQHAKDPYAVPFLRQAIGLKPQLSYLDYDDYGSYYKKCLWALQAIGTAEAISIIQECACSEDEALKDQARYRTGKI